MTGTAKEGWSSLRSTTGASELNGFREQYEQAKERYNIVQLPVNEFSAQEKHSAQLAMKKAEQEYQKKRDDVANKLDKRLASGGYTKINYPEGNNSGINPSILVKDAKSAGVDNKFIEEYQNARKEYEREYAIANEKYEKKKNSSGLQSLYSRMPWDYPEVEKADRKKDDLENLLVQALYEESTLPWFYKKK